MALSEAADIIPSGSNNDVSIPQRLPDGTHIASNHNSGRGVTSEINHQGNLITKYLPESLKKYNFLEVFPYDEKVQGAFVGGVLLGCLLVRILNK